MLDPNEIVGYWYQVDYGRCNRSQTPIGSPAEFPGKGLSVVNFTLDPCYTCYRVVEDALNIESSVPYEFDGRILLLQEKSVLAFRVHPLHQDQWLLEDPPQLVLLTRQFFPHPTPLLDLTHVGFLPHQIGCKSPVSKALPFYEWFTTIEGEEYYLGSTYIDEDGKIVAVPVPMVNEALLVRSHYDKAKK